MAFLYFYGREGIPGQSLVNSGIGLFKDRRDGMNDIRSQSESFSVSPMLWGLAAPGGGIVRLTCSFTYVMDNI